ncbi:MAG: hypothetical protein IJV98_06820 [Clostridia bacterium]|nr:hypothetical protein [Clostridia bacterium]
MEIKRKKITDEKIYETEQTLIRDITALCEQKRDDFAALGYELELIFSQKENEAQHLYAPYQADPAKCFDAGYVSRALINVKRFKTEEEIAEDLCAEQTNREMLDAAESEEEVQALQDEEELRLADDRNRRLAAFTELMMTRTYRAFWTEWASLADGIHEIEDDLTEFYGKLKEKAANA